MAILDAGSTIKAYRKAAGLTQEQLSEGVCSAQALSMIECGRLNPTSETFQRLMQNAGIICEAYPSFVSEDDFFCYLLLQHSAYYIETWQLALAHDTLKRVSEYSILKNNKIYYQSWLLHNCQLRIFSGTYDADQVYELVLSAIQLTQPSISMNPISAIRLSLAEYKLFSLLAYLSAFSDRVDDGILICGQLREHVISSGFDIIDINNIIAEISLAEAWCYFHKKDMRQVFRFCSEGIDHLSVTNTSYLIFELYLLKSLAVLRDGNRSKGVQLFLTAYYGSLSVNSAFSVTCVSFVEKYAPSAKRVLDAYIRHPKTDSRQYPLPEIIDRHHSCRKKVGFSANRSDIVTIGRLIQIMRTKQKLPLRVLSNGLCNQSTLSKIENGTLQPSIDLYSALLQRLGINERIFTFYGNAHEMKLQQLKTSFSAIVRKNYDKMILSEIKLLSEECNQSDYLTRQFIRYQESKVIKQPGEKEAMLWKTLQMTCPDFDFKDIDRFRYSWLELNILSQICEVTTQKSFARGIGYFYSLLNFYHTTDMDILHQKRMLPVVLNKAVFYLWRQKQYDDIILLSDSFLSPVSQGKLSVLYTLNAHFAEALLETGADRSQAEQVAHYAYYTMKLLKEDKSADEFQHHLSVNYQIDPCLC